jgi:hypothetical protein
MDRNRQPPPDSTRSARDVQEDPLSRPASPPPMEGQRDEPARGVEREGIGPEEDLPERQSLGSDEALPGRGNRSEESI